MFDWLGGGGSFIRLMGRTSFIYLSIYLYILPHALADILGRLAHRLLVSDRKRKGKGGIKLFILVGWGRSFLSVDWPTGVQLVFFFCSGVSRLFGAQGSPSSGSLLSL